MLYALLNNIKTEAFPKSKAECPLCRREVYSRCGDVNEWHWAHSNEKSCDNWFEPETEWHKNWKKPFGKELTEVIIIKNGKKHIADIQTKDKIVIELQNSSISKSIIAKRENFYGESMIWIINGENFKSNFEIISPNNSKLFFGVSQGYVHKKLGILIKKGYDFFIWKWSKSSWDELERPVFIDFGDENLFWVKAGMGTNYGYGKTVTKVDFLNKYLQQNFIQTQI